MNYQDWSREELINEVVRLKEDQKLSHSFAKADSMAITNAHVIDTENKNRIKNLKSEVDRLSLSLKDERKIKNQYERKLKRLGAI